MHSLDVERDPAPVRAGPRFRIHQQMPPQKWELNYDYHVNPCLLTDNPWSIWKKPLKEKTEVQEFQSKEEVTNQAQRETTPDKLVNQEQIKVFSGPTSRTMPGRREGRCV